MLFKDIDGCYIDEVKVSDRNKKSHWRRIGGSTANRE